MYRVSQLPPAQRRYSCLCRERENVLSEPEGYFGFPFTRVFFTRGERTRRNASPFRVTLVRRVSRWPKGVRVGNGLA